MILLFIWAIGKIKLLIRMYKKITILLILLLVISISGCDEEEIETKTLQQFTSPLYLTVIIHTEEDTSKCSIPKAQIPDYDGNEELLLHFTMVMREFAEMVASHNAKINFGTDWTFANGIEAYDPTFFTDIEALGHEVDAHAHASCVLYHELRQDIIDAGASPTAVASGVNEAKIYEEMDYFDQYYPEYEILWGVAAPGHGAGEEISTWVWRPSKDNWLEHDPNGKYIHIGHGEQIASVDLIQDTIDNRKPNYINTYAVFTNPREFLAAKGTSGIPDQWTTNLEDPNYWENKLQWWDEFLTELDEINNLQYASLTEIADIFVEAEDNLDFNFGEHPRSDLSMTTRKKMLENS